MKAYNSIATALVRWMRMVSEICVRRPPRFCGAQSPRNADRKKDELVQDEVSYERVGADLERISSS